MRHSFALPRWLQVARNAALDALFPPRCVGCERWLEGTAWRQDPFCPVCRRQIIALQAPLCERCGASVANSTAVCAECHDATWPSTLKMVRAVGQYEGPLRDGIHHFKYRDQWSVSEGLGAQLGAWCLSQPGGVTAIPIKKLALIVPIPMHSWRQWRRGYNQSSLLAAQLSQHLQIPTAELLRRTRYTPPQVSMDGDARRSNIHGVFALRDSERAKWQRVLAQQPILLLDDVFTTGTTLRECAQTLQREGACEIYALALARAGDRNPQG